MARKLLSRFLRPHFRLMLDEFLTPGTFPFLGPQLLASRASTYHFSVLFFLQEENRAALTSLNVPKDNAFPKLGRVTVKTTVETVLMSSIARVSKDPSAPEKNSAMRDHLLHQKSRGPLICLRATYQRKRGDNPIILEKCTMMALYACPLSYHSAIYNYVIGPRSDMPYSGVS